MPGPRRTLVLLCVAVTMHALAVLVQVVVAGSYLDGSGKAMVVHGSVGLSAVFLAVAQLIAAVLFWRPGRGGLWPTGVAALLLAANGLEVGLGYTRSLAIHVPLGVAIVVVSLAFAAWALNSASRLVPTESDAGTPTTPGASTGAAA
ncbi:hypothetical protein [Pedococcus dokdonensis]|nr:hypothetical protein [Pedococcus dokdonensis]